MDDSIEAPLYFPFGVTGFVGLRSTCFIGAFDIDTVLKYPRISGDKTTLQALRWEAEALRRIGPHHNITALREESPDGIPLDRAKNGTVANFVQKMGEAQIMQHLW